MPAQTPCVRCRRTGFVRIERIIKAGETTTAYYCGACDSSWTVAEEERRANPRPERGGEIDPPERSRG